MKLAALIAFTTLAAHGGALSGSVGPDETERAAPLRVAQSSPDPAPVDRMQRLREADAELRAANAALARAQQQLDAGKEPLPGERTGMVNGMSRLNETYWARQAANEAAVKEARARRDAALAARNAARF